MLKTVDGFDTNPFLRHRHGPTTRPCEPAVRLPEAAVHPQKLRLSSAAAVPQRVYGHCSAVALEIRRALPLLCICHEICRRALSLLRLFCRCCAKHGIKNKTRTRFHRCEKIFEMITSVYTKPRYLKWKKQVFKAFQRKRNQRI